MGYWGEGRGWRTGVPAAIGVTLLLAAWGAAQVEVSWPHVRQWLGANGIMVALTGGGVVFLLVSALELFGRRARSSSHQAPMSWWAVGGGLVLVVVVAWAATAWLLFVASGAQDPAAAKVDAVKTGLGVGAGVGAVLALLLAVRRQWHHEITALDTAHDATERRVTDLYTKAAEQLGSDKASVRLAGLYALERLAQDNRTQRQTIVNVWCAYLRMPYVLPSADVPAPDDAGFDEYQERVQEREVRLTAQRLLGLHLQPGAEKQPLVTFWENIDVNLTGASLIDLDLSYCTLGAVNFQSARFAGSANFGSARFTGQANFRSATFGGPLSFRAATFTDSANFGNAVLVGTTINFGAANFLGTVNFGGADFKAPVNFDQATFALAKPREVAHLSSDGDANGPEASRS